MDVTIGVEELENYEIMGRLNGWNQYHRREPADRQAFTGRAKATAGSQVSSGNRQYRRRPDVLSLHQWLVKKPAGVLR